METGYHIGIKELNDIKYVLLTGDPGRVKGIAMKLKNPCFVMQNREYLSWCGELEGKKVLVISTGIGGPSAAIAVEELCLLGADTFIRIGTCGGMQLEVESQDIVIPTAAIRFEGTSKEYIPIEFPAVSSYDVTVCLHDAAQAMGFNSHMGIIQSKDSFYGQHSPERMPLEGELIDKWEAWIKGGCLASEMECAAIFIVSTIRRVRSGAVLLTVWNQEREKKGLPNPQILDVERAAVTAIEGLRRLIKADKGKEVVLILNKKY